MICHPTANICFQRAQLGRTTLQCDGEFCQQSCSNGDCNLVCPVGVKTCEQSGAGGNITMRCQGDVCRQTCTSGSCNLICSENVKECHQACSTAHGNCHFKCAAEMCELTCLGPRGSCNAVISDGNLTIGSLAFLEFLLVVVFIATLNDHLILRKQHPQHRSRVTMAIQQKIMQGSLMYISSSLTYGLISGEYSNCHLFEL